MEMGSWRPPLSMVDRIIDFKYGENGFIKVIKHVTFNDPYLQGHFPEDPIMPGVMISEIFGQASEYLSFMTDICDIYHSRLHIDLRSLRDIFAHIKSNEMLNIIRVRRAQVRGVLASQNLKFKNSVYPGDSVEVTSKLVFSDAKGFKHYSVNAIVGNRIISQGTIINYREVDN